MHVSVGGVLVLCYSAVTPFLGLTDVCKRWWCVGAMLQCRNALIRLDKFM